MEHLMIPMPQFDKVLLKVTTEPDPMLYLGCEDDIQKWKYCITTGVKCQGLKSGKSYTTQKGAIRAGKLMAKKLMGLR